MALQRVQCRPRETGAQNADMAKRKHVPLVSRRSASKAKTVDRHAPYPAREPKLPNRPLRDIGSGSSSPILVKTPDGESFEVEMLDAPDMRTFYSGRRNLSTHGSYQKSDVRFV